MGKISIQDLAAKLVEQNGLSKRDAMVFVNTMFDIVRQALDYDKMVKIKGLGTFKIVEVDARESVNVNTGERVLIDGHNKISFMPDTLMKELVNKPFSQFETVVLNEGVDFEEGQEQMRREAMAAQAVSEADTDTASLPLVDFGPSDEISHVVFQNVEDENLDVEESLDDDEEPVEEESLVDEESAVEEEETDLGTETMVDEKSVPDEIPMMDEKSETSVMEESVVNGESVAEEPVNQGEEPIVLNDEPVVLGEEPDVKESPAAEDSPASNEQVITEEPTIADQLFTEDEPGVEDIPVVENPVDETKSVIEDNPEEETVVNDDMMSDEDKETDSEEDYQEDDEEYDTPWYKRWLLLLIVGLVCLLVGYLCGYYMAYLHQDGSADEQVPPVVVEPVDKNPASESIEQAVVDDSTVVDSKVGVNLEDSLASEVASEVEETQTAEPLKESLEKAAIAAPVQTQPQLDQYEAKDARVRTGAYRIIGTDHMEKVREGDNLKRISRRTLGPDMECYIEVYNNLTSASPLKAGQQIKIPKLQHKKKKSTQK